MQTSRAFGGLAGIVVTCAALLFGGCPSSRGNGPRAATTLAPDAGADAALDADARATSLADAGGPLSRDEICARTPVARARGLDGKEPFTGLVARCTAKNPLCDTVDKSPDPKATCFVANDNLAKAERESRTARGQEAANAA
jgi:hypothetical protein